MIDVQKLINDATYRQRSIDKGADSAVIDKVCELSAKRSQQIQITDAARSQANAIAKAIGAAAPEERESSSGAAAPIALAIALACDLAASVI